MGFNKLIFMGIILTSVTCFAAREHPESYYQDKFCSSLDGIREVQLEDRSRVDCLTGTHALEFDFGNKWREGVGQSLSYGYLTKKRSGVVLILENLGDFRYVVRILNTIKYYDLPVDVWVIFGNEILLIE